MNSSFVVNDSTSCMKAISLWHSQYKRHCFISGLMVGVLIAIAKNQTTVIIAQ
jgi:hypothetical protein